MRKKVLLRFDDICPTMNWAEWNKAKTILDKNNIKALLGVIPDCRDKELMIDNPRTDFWEYIRELEREGFTIAMHGYQHLIEVDKRGVICKKVKSEFAGLPYDVQLKKIQKGREILEGHGLYPDIFFAPAHSYDDNTIKALGACGFRYMSDGMSLKPYECHGVICIPARSGGIPKRTFMESYYTAIIHAHEWVLEDKKENWDRYVQLCQMHNRSVEIVPFSLYKQRQTGSFYIQKIDEKVFKIWAKKIKPILACLVKRIC